MPGFLSGLAGFVGPAVNVATQAEGAQVAGENTARQQNVQTALQQLALMRQQQEDQLRRQLTQAQIARETAQTGDINAQTTLRGTQQDQETYLHGPEFQQDFSAAQGGDSAAQAKVAGRLAGHPAAQAILSAITPKKQLKAVQDKNGNWTTIDEATGLDPQGHPVQGFVPKPPAEKAIKTWQGPNGETLNLPEGQLPPQGYTPYSAAKGGGSTTQGAQAPLDDMLDRFEEIQQHADRVAKGQQKITRAYQMREGTEYGIARANASGQHIPTTQMATAAVQDVLPAGMGGVDANDKDYQRYQALMNSQRALGDDVAKVFKGRQNEDAVLREIALAQLQPGDYQNATVTAQKLDRLRNVIKLAAETNPGQVANTDLARLQRITGLTVPAGGGGRGGGANTQRPAWAKNIPDAEWQAYLASKRGTP